MKLSDKLIDLRKGKGWSQEDFAEKLDVSRQAISRWENGTALPDAQNIVRISKLFNVTADYLLNDEYEGETLIPVVETVTEETEPLTQKKKYWYWYLIFAICLIALVVCITMNVMNSTNDRTNEVHTHLEFQRITENEVAPTCVAEGSYDEVVYCTDCGEEILRTTKSVAKLSHTLLGSVKENEIVPTCTAEGSYDEVVYCTDCGEEILHSTKSIAKLSHTLSGSMKENEIVPTCTAEGSYNEVVYCTDCGEEILRTTKSIAKLAHTLTKSVKENEVAPTCKAKGTYDEVVYCSACGEEVLRTHRRTDKTDHQYQNGKCIVCEKYKPSEGLGYMPIGDGTCMVDCGSCTDENIVIPEYSPSGDMVTGIKAYAFSGRKNIKSVRIPETVTSIGEGAFETCENLESVNLPSRITRINSYTFKDCKSLKEITIPDDVYYIGIEAFENCVSCMSIVIPASVTKIGNEAFKNFSSCKGTVTFEVYRVWVMYDNMGEIAGFVDFGDSRESPTYLITFDNCEYWWRLEPEYTMWSTGRTQQEEEIVETIEEIPSDSIPDVEAIVTADFSDAPFSDVEENSCLSDDEITALVEKIPSDKYESYPNTHNIPISATLYKNGEVISIDLYDERLIGLINMFNNSVYYSRCAYTQGLVTIGSAETQMNCDFRLELEYSPYGNLPAPYGTCTTGCDTMIISKYGFLMMAHDVPGYEHDPENYPFWIVIFDPWCMDYYNCLEVFGF